MNKLLADIIDDWSMGSHVVSTVNLAKISKECMVCQKKLLFVLLSKI